MVRNKTSSKHGYKSWALLGFLQEEMGFTLEVMDLYNLVDDLSMKIIQQIKSMVYVLVDDSCRKDMIIVSPENHLYRYYICWGDESNCSAPNLVLLFFLVCTTQMTSIYGPKLAPLPALWPCRHEIRTEKLRLPNIYFQTNPCIPICIGLLKRDGWFFRWRNGAVEAPMTLGPMMLIHLMRKGYI